MSEYNLFMYYLNEARFIYTAQFRRYSFTRLYLFNRVRFSDRSVTMQLMGQTLGQRLEQRMSQSQIQSLDILAMPAIELREKIAEELAENPA